MYKVATELNENLNDKAKNSEEYDLDRIEYYRYIIDTMVERAKYFAGKESSFVDDTNSDPTAKLLQFAQNIHMIEHEVEYALYKLPELSKDIDDAKASNDYENTHWYYVKNVKSSGDNYNEAGEYEDDGKTYYAAYNGNDNPMSLGDKNENCSMWLNCVQLR